MPDDDDDNKEVDDEGDHDDNYDDNNDDDDDKSDNDVSHQSVRGQVRGIQAWGGEIVSGVAEMWLYHHYHHKHHHQHHHHHYQQHLHLQGRHEGFQTRNSCLCVSSLFQRPAVYKVLLIFVTLMIKTI